MDCVQMYHMLKTVTGRREADEMSGPSNSQIEDLGRCVNRTQSRSLAITSGFRIIRRIESAVRERAKCASDLRRASLQIHHGESYAVVDGDAGDAESFRYTPSPTYSTHGFQTAPGGLRRGGAFEVSELKRHGNRTRSVRPESLVPASVTVCRCFTTLRPLLTGNLFNVDTVCFIYRWASGSPGRHESDSNP